MKHFKRLAMGLFATALICLTTSSVLAAPTTQNFSSPVVIQNDITFSAINNINFGTVTAPLAGTEDTVILTTATQATPTTAGAGSFTVASPSADVVTLTWTPDMPNAGTSTCTGGTGTAPVMSALTLSVANFANGTAQSVQGGVASTMGGTLTVDASTQGTWACAYSVEAAF